MVTRRRMLGLAGSWLALLGLSAGVTAAVVKPTDVAGSYTGDAASSVSGQTYDAEFEVTHVQKRKVTAVMTLLRQNNGEPYATVTLSGNVNPVGLLTLTGQAELPDRTVKALVRAYYFVDGRGRRNLNATYLFKKQGDRGSVVTLAEDEEEA